MNDDTAVVVGSENGHVPVSPAEPSVIEAMQPESATDVPDEEIKTPRRKRRVSKRPMYLRTLSGDVVKGEDGNKLEFEKVKDAISYASESGLVGSFEVIQIRNSFTLTKQEKSILEITG